MPRPEFSQRMHLPHRAVALLLPGDGAVGGPHGLDLRAASTHFGGTFRTVDFALSNCLNSGIRRVCVVTPYKSHSLQRHLERGWAFLNGDANAFVNHLQVPRPPDDEERPWGRSDAVVQNLDLLESFLAEYVLVLDGDHIYKMNYATMLADHVAKGRACTVACTEVARSDATAGSVLAMDEHGRITGFAEQSDPAGGAERVPASMGIYIFNARYLYAALARDMADPASSHDFARDIFAHAVRSGDAAAHPFARSCVGTAPGNPPYWRDVSTIDAYWDANIDLTATEPLLDLYDAHWPIKTHHADLAPAKFMHNPSERCGVVVESLVSAGSVVSGSVQRSVLFSAVRVHSSASIEASVLLPCVQVGRDARLRRVVVDRACTIPAGMVIGEDPADDARRFVRSDRGITFVTAAMLARLDGPGPRTP